MSIREFASMYASNGRPSIAPDKLLRALLLMVPYTIPSERRLMSEDYFSTDGTLSR